MRPLLNIESIATFLFEDLAVASGLFGNMDDYQILPVPVRYGPNKSISRVFFLS